MKSLLLVIDPQIDFIGGSLSVSGAAGAMLDLSIWIGKNPELFTDIIVTLDSHLPGHVSFKSSWKNPEEAPEGLDLWPDHCVVGTMGHSIYVPLLNALKSYKKATGKAHMVVLKGNDPTQEMYSAIGATVSNYQGGLEYTPQLNAKLFEQYDTIYVAGIARDYCVASTVKDMLEAFPEATRGKVKLLLEYMPFIVEEEPEIFIKAVSEGWAEYK